MTPNPEELKRRVEESRVTCVGDGVKGCGYIGGKSGFACPECGGMLLSEASQLKANMTTIEWLGGFVEIHKSERDALQTKLDASERREAELLQIIEARPHDLSCRWVNPDLLAEREQNSGLYGCTCWKSRALALLKPQPPKP